jgi:VCBS repeat-containing protein
MKQVAWLLGAVVLLVGAASATAAPGAPQLAFNPASGTFGPVAVGDTTAAQQFVLTNSGTVGTAMLKVSLSGDDAAQFTITANTCAATSLGPNKKCSVSVQYTPSAPGASDTAILTAESKKPAAKATVALSGSGIQPNRPPDAADVSLPMNEDQSLFGVISVLDPDGDPVSLFVNSPAAHGTLTLNSDGSFTYTPNPNYNGEDSFTYGASDWSLPSNYATVTITVNSVNDAPVANNDGPYTAHNDTPLTVSAADGVLTNDTDIDGPNPLIAEPLGFTTIAGGSVVLNLDGSFTYTAPAGYVGGDFFRYFARDGGLDGISDIATVTIDVREPT